MTAQPNPSAVHNAARTQVPTVKSNSSLNVSSSKTMRSDSSTGLGSEPVASLEISEAGREMATHLSHKINNQSEAKQQLDVIHKQLKAKPETVESVHSNLRALKINHLIFD